MTFRTLALLGGVVLAGCGGGGGGSPDARATGDATGGPDALDPCSYHEANDVANDTTAEATGQTVSASGVVLCGQIDARTPGSDGLVDDDLYTVTVPSDGAYLVRIASSEAGNLDLVQAYFVDDRHAGIYVGTHGTFVAPLTAGDHALEIDGFSAAAPAAAIRYRLSITPDDVDTRCAALTTSPTYTEATDGTGHTGNDVVTVTDTSSFVVGQTPDTPTADAPEPTGLVIAPAMSYALAGATESSANTYNDNYVDRDTYLIATGANTNELSIRIDWVDAATTADDADLDAFLFTVAPDATTAPIAISGSIEEGTAGPEFTTTAVLPSTNYWLWVGSFKGQGLGNDKPYTITVCGATFTP